MTRLASKLPFEASKIEKNICKHKIIVNHELINVIILLDLLINFELGQGLNVSDGEQ